MGKIEEVIRSEISRLARKTTKGTLKSLTRNVSQLKRSVSQLSKTVAVLQKKIARHSRDKGAHNVKLGAPEGEVKSARFTPRLIKKLRKRLGITQGDLALILDVSKGAVVSWESGRSAPRYARKAAMVALRKLGRRDIKKTLAEKGKRPKKRAKKKRARKRKGAK
jgi:DNA-binding XRE family transcriptional regulator